MATQFAVDLVFRGGKGTSQINAFERRLRKLEAAAKGAQRGAESAGDAAEKAGREASSSANGWNRLKGSLVQVAAAMGGVALAQQALQAGIRREESVRRLTFLARGYGEVTALQEAATAASIKFGASQTEANEALANIYARLRPIGTSLEDITSIYNGFNTAARVSGASAEEASNAFTQLAQALGSGALRGDEFNSISEQVPGILTAIAQETGVAQGKLRDFAAEGGITSEVVLGALKRIEKDGADQLSEALNGPAQKIKDFQNATEEVQVALTKDIIPPITESVKELTALIEAIGPVVSIVGRVVGGVLRTTVAQLNAAKQAIANLFSGNFGALFRFNKNGYNDLFGIETGPKKVSYPVQQFRYSDGLSARQAAAGSSSGGGGGGSGGKTAQEKENESLAEYARILGVVTPLTRQMSQASMELGTSQIDLNSAFTETNTELTEQGEVVQSLGQSITNSLGGALKGLMDGTKTMQQVFADFFQGIADSFFDMAMQILQSALTKQLLGLFGGMTSTTSSGGLLSAFGGFGTNKNFAGSIFGGPSAAMPTSFLQGAFGGGFSVPGFADGGVTPRNRPFVVGENGPELMMSSSQHRVVPGDQMGNVNSVVNVNISDSGTQVDAERSGKMGRLIEASVIGVIQRERRPGGMLS